MTITSDPIANQNLPPLDSQAMNQTTRKTIRSDSGSFEEIAMPILPDLYRIALGHTKGNHADAEDLVQETFIKAFRAFSQFQQGTSIKAWMSTIMRNTFLNKAEKQSRDKSSGNSVDAMEEWELGTASSVTASPALSAEEQAIENIPDPVIQQALAKIKPEFRQVVQLAIVDELPYAEIAKRMNTPVGTVMSRLHRGKAALREILSEYAAEQGIGAKFRNIDSESES